MSKETQEWLENNIRVGFTNVRGAAWWYQDDEQSHYELEVPREEAERILTVPVGLYPVYVGTEDDSSVGDMRVPDRWAVVHKDTKEVFYIGSNNYTIHDYVENLLEKTETIADGTGLGISSVGILQGGARAFIQYEFTDTLEVGDTGESIRPFLGVTTSLDGSSATTWKMGCTRMVCDNTVDMWMLENSDQQISLRHSKGVSLNVLEARNALGMLEKASEDFQEVMQRMIERTVEEQQWQAFLQEYAPINPEDEKEDSKGSKQRITRAENLRSELNRLYYFDGRCAPWTGTEWGVLQTCNTYNQHYRTVKGSTASRAERNILNFYDGKTEQQDAHTMKVLQKVLAAS